ncbi:MAG: YqcC family protein [Alteromonadaceae bacterium]|nr:YqcC family protein [Alteromonadaceae bacterium]
MIRESHNIQHRGAALLMRLKSVMITADIWSSQMPSAQALASQQPFACDTLTFEQWLQFIFIPRLDALFSRGEIAPPMSILPMAHMTWGHDHQVVQAVISEFDEWSKTVHG